MVSIQWCLKKEGGLELSEPNAVMARSYLGMAEDSLKDLENVKTDIWKATITYYSFYYSLYALMMRIGVKCEIHSCSLEFMDKLLGDLYSKEDIEMINKAFGARINLQYYANRPIDEKVIKETRAYVSDFLSKTKDVITNITNNQIISIRKKLK